MPEELHIWVAQRAASKSKWPLLLDPTVAGGHAHGLSLAQSAAKEAAEEAAVSGALMAQAVPAGCVGMLTCDDAGDASDGAGLRQAECHVWDLEVPPDWQPRAADGEVRSLLARVLDLLTSA